MATASSVVAGVIQKTNVSWSEYRAISKEMHSDRNVRLTFDRGTLQIMTLSVAHESPKSALSDLVKEAAAALDLEIWETGSTTFDREDLQRGFEPDTSFYFRDLRRLMARSEIDLARDPAPDLVIEIDIASNSLNKLPLFAAVGVAEVWRWDGENVSIHVLENGAYRLSGSRWLPPLTAEAATEFVRLRRTEPRIRAWREAVRDWFETRTTA